MKISRWVYAVILLSLLLAAASLSLQDYAGRNVWQSADPIGMELMHPAGQDTRWGMPLWPVCTELLSSSVKRHCAMVEAVSGLLLVMTLAAFADMASGLAGLVVLAAGCWFSFDPSSGIFTFFAESRMYCMLVTLALSFLVLWARKPDRTRAFLAGISIAATLMFKSPLLLLPPFVCLYMFLYAKEADRKQLYIFMLSAYSFTMIWWLMNFLEYGDFLFAEGGRANANIIAGALGLTGSTEGDIAAFAGLQSGADTFSWAAHWILTHPAVYVSAVARRIVFALSSNSIYWVFGLAGFWRNRSKREWQLLCLFCVYFLLAHCTMAVESRYFQPLLPLLMAASGAFFAALPVFNGFGVQSRWSGRAAVFVFAAISPFAAYTLALTASYPVRDICFRGSVKQYLARFPDNFTLLAARAEELRNEGSARENLAVREKLYLLSGGRGESAQYYAIALLAADKPAGPLIDSFDVNSVEYHFFKMLADLHRDTAQARDEYEKALFCFGHNRGVFRGTAFARDRELYGKFSSPGRDESERGLNSWLKKLPRDYRFETIRKMRIAGIDCGFYAYDCVLDYEKSSPAQSLELLELVFKGSTANAAYISERGALKAKTGDLRGGLSDTDSAIRLSPDYYRAHEIKGDILVAKAGNYAAGCAEYKKALSLCRACAAGGCAGTGELSARVQSCGD
jgi:tetratricopeptide (TPR) repeat protein